MKPRFATVSMAFFLLAGSAFAHHSWGEYDMGHGSTVTGIITEFDWANPHVWMYFDVKDEHGNIQKWAAGGPSAGRMEHSGWNKTTLKPGDQITAVSHQGRHLQDASLEGHSSEWDGADVLRRPPSDRSHNRRIPISPVANAFGGHGFRLPAMIPGLHSLRFAIILCLSSCLPRFISRTSFSDPAARDPAPLCFAHEIRFRKNSMGVGGGYGWSDPLRKTRAD